jgi:hypothetical protein
MEGAVADRLLYVQVAVTDLDIVSTDWVSADPSLEIDRCALATEVG